MKKTQKFVFIFAFALSILPTINYAGSKDCGGGKIHSISEGWYGYPDFSFRLESGADSYLATSQYGRTDNLLDGRRAIIGAYFGDKFVKIFNPYQPVCLDLAQVDVVVCNTAADCENLTH